MPPIQATEFWLYYALAAAVVLVYLASRRPRRGMRLRLREAQEPAQTLKVTQIAQAIPIRPNVERPLNVVFNYNGHSWDAYEVLGLAAGSSAEKVEAAYQESLARVDFGSRPFMEAAYRAIQNQGRVSKASAN